MSDESESDISNGLDLNTVTLQLARERAYNSIRIRRARTNQPNRAMVNVPAQTFHPEDQLSVIANEAETKFSPENLVSTFQSMDVTAINNFCVECAQFIAAYPELTVVNDSEVFKLIVSVSTLFNTRETVSNYLAFLVRLAAKHDNELVDADMFFIIGLEVVKNFPHEVCEFYIAISAVSKYAKNAILCTGVINELINEFNQTSDESLHTDIAKAIHAVLAASLPEDADAIRVFLPGIIDMFNSSNVNAIYYVLLCLDEILAISTSFISQMFKYKVHTIIVELMKNPVLAEPCLAIAGNMAICPDDEIMSMMPIFEAARDLIGGDLTGDVFWCLMNGLDSCPVSMIPFFDLSFIETMASLLHNSPYGVLRDVSCFAATLLVLAPPDELKIIVSHKVLGPLIEMLDCGNPPIILRCLDGLKKVVMFAFRDSSMIEAAPDLFQNDEVAEVLSRLQQAEEQMIVSRAAQLEIDLQQLTS